MFFYQFLAQQNLPLCAGNGWVQSNVTKTKYYCRPDEDADFFGASSLCIARSTADYQVTLASIDNAFENADITSKGWFKRTYKV